MSEKKTGLGKAAFFSRPAPDDIQGDQSGAPIADVPQEEAKPQKVRTTVTLYPETLAAMELLKVEARKSGVKATFSDVLHDAIHALMQQKGLTLE